MKDNELDSMNTPSYPSGHSTQGVLIALVLSDMYCEHQYNLMELAKDISYSRNVARAHYPSDSRFGEKLGGEMFKYLKKMGRI
jgi:acid phosphatase (class A)